ncbi:unnamed protein product [Chironomus riparius]|uniref:LRRCT domain-containing protein n=1 Tax=Chironomus riparius TaxID=315576 RepID=A0A9N9WS03_9DIPT|nr:unnamed protein product [Chironomus riparius]
MGQSLDRAWDRCTEEGFCRCLPVLKQISCWHLGLKNIPSTQSVPNDITHIDLSYNELTTLHRDTFRGLTHLTILDLSRNRLNFLPNDLLLDLDSLSTLRLQENNLQRVDNQLFLKLRSLKILDVSINHLSNALPLELFQSIYHIKVINFSNNKLNKFPLLLEQSELEELDISKNEICAIDNKDLFELKKLKTLRLSENSLAFVSEEKFYNSYKRKPFQKLKEPFDIGFGSKQNPIDASICFSQLEKGLKRLMLFSNNFKYLHSNSFEGLSSLSSLLLNNNNLKDFDADVFSPLISLSKLRLDSNKLQFLPKDCLDNIPKLTKIKLDKNPWHCDCQSIYLARFLRKNFEKLWNGEAGIPLCLGPGELGGKQVSMLRFDHLCYGQWFSMVNLAARVPVKKQTTDAPALFFQQMEILNYQDKKTTLATEKPDFEEDLLR